MSTHPKTAASKITQVTAISSALRPSNWLANLNWRAWRAKPPDGLVKLDTKTKKTSDPMVL